MVRVHRGELTARFPTWPFVMSGPGRRAHRPTPRSGSRAEPNRPAWTLDRTGAVDHLRPAVQGVPITRSADRLVVHSRLAPWLVGLGAPPAAGCLILAVTADRASLRWTLVSAALSGVVLAVRVARMDVLADAEGLTARQVGSTRRYRWSQISELGTHDHVRIAARLDD